MGAGESVARNLLALVVFGLALSYIHYGPGGPTRWVKAKFLGKT
jgi:hypothetical protein